MFVIRSCTTLPVSSQRSYCCFPIQSLCCCRLIAAFCGTNIAGEQSMCAIMGSCRGGPSILILRSEGILINVSWLSGSGGRTSDWNP